uniref:1,4-dihydroxy-2-naphthoate polyprenyltransferase (EC) n=1 Tax=uncultured Thiotrichaceae bacterium TaxID=298394 RepID=A0A6S6UMD9_9GAMM|nr:MAG: 1,4-dihydroxy-2-naphthoate polyprenyltransferase (EC [uncultured Thiotrichaceae bacterium]
MPLEPDKTLREKPLLRYWLATRPPFMAASLVPVLLGAAAVAHQGKPVSIILLLLTLLAIILVHGGVNVLNDYYDELNGTDRQNTQRIFPFTGGSRFIQNDVMTASETFWFGTALIAVAILLGIALAITSGMGLIWVGIAGLLLGWGYSAPPLSLNSRGMGEIAVALGFGIVTPLGAWYVQTSIMDWYPVIISIPISLLVMNILVINQFPDLSADKASGKYHWVVRLGTEKGPFIYLAAVALAALTLLTLIASEFLPVWAILSGLPLLLAAKAGLLLKQHAAKPVLLEPAIKMTIGSTVLHGIILSLILSLT